MAIDHEGDGAKGIALLEEVLAADSTFAMAWRKIGAEKRNRRYPRSEWVDALFRAYELSDRLTERRPNLPVLFMSGYTDRYLGRDGMVSATVHFLK